MAQASGLHEERISIQAVIGSFISKLQIRNVNHVIDDLVRWAFEAEMKIGSQDTYKKFECEIDIKNYRACLPPGFVKLVSMKYGEHYLEVTKKEFTHFYKGTAISTPKEDPKFTSGNNRKVNIPGCLQVSQIEVTGTWSAGEQAILHITVVDNGNTWTNSYTYIVQPGDTFNNVAQGLYNQLAAIGNAPFIPTISGNVIELTGRDFCVTFNVTTFTDSPTGCLDYKLIQASKEPRTIEHDNNGLKSPKTESKNLAQRNALNMGQSRNAQNRSSTGYYPGYGDGAYYSSVPKFSISNGYIHFNVSGEEHIDKVGIAYWGIWLDDDGFPLIKASHDDAVSSYLMYMYKTADFVNGKTPMYVYNKLEETWFRLCAQARGDDELPDLKEMEYLSNQWNQLVPMVNKNVF